jgi:aspartate racemase
MSVLSTSVSANGEEGLNGETFPQVAPANEACPDPARSDYWESYLAEVAALELPTDRLRPAVLPPTMGMESCLIREELLEGLNQLSREARIPIATAILAAFTALLHRYTAQEKFVIAAGGAVSELIPLVADFSDQPSARNLMGRLDAAISHCSKAPTVPENLAERMGIEPDRSRHPIFQVAFSSGNESIASKQLDLHLQLAGNSLTLYYNQALFETSTVSRMLGHLQELLSGEVKDCNCPIAQLPMLSDRELHEHLVERNRTARDFPVPQRCLHELVEATAVKAPNEIAVIHGNEQLSYLELNARANQLAHYLRKRRISRNARVGICLKRSLDFAVALLGVLKAGGTCVPLDPAYPSERLTLMLEDVAAPIVLDERGLLQANVPGGTQVVHLSEERQKIVGESRNNPFAGSTPGDIAYVIYTSGSTGRPRGVLLPHAGLANYSLAAAELFAIHPGDRMLQFCSISFDAAIEEIFSTWVAGATLVFRMEDVSLEPGEMLGWMSQQRISVVDLPTAYWHEWVYALTGLREKVPSSLRLVIVGGEKASPEAYATWHKVVGGRVRWINTYGPAEASVVALTYEPKLQASDKAPSVLPIGRPVANARVYLLDPYLNPVPVGVPGELHIGGIGVAQGYLNQPRLTEEKFIPDVFTGNKSSRLYKTGDLGRYTESGEIEFVGRLDNQVKIRGFRIEPGEIESVLAKHDGVQEAAVVVREDSPGTKRLVAYVVCISREAVVESDLRRHVQSRLPEYMMPSEFVFLDSMPLTPNGKVNRRALSALRVDSPLANAQVVGANDPLQAQLIEIWEEVLGRRPIGILDNFFELGGHSLLAARLMHRIRQILGKTIPLAALLQAPTIHQLAAVLQDESSHCWNSLVALQPEGTRPAFFCVHGVGGNVVGFHELARRMKPHHPFYGLQSQGLDGQRPCLTSIEDMASHYLKEIRTVQAKGPYYLGGFSLGGLVAYEMARQLVDRGEEVGLVALFDTYARNLKPVSLLDLLRNPGQVRITQVPTAIRKKIRRTILALRLPEVLKKVGRTNAQAADKYRLQPFGGRAVLLRAEDTWRVGEDPYAAWHHLVAELETVEIRGAHMDILREPQVSHLAERLKRCIDGTSAD